MLLEHTHTMNTPKEPVRLRRRKTPAGRISLYLDIYINGKRRYEYLGLYLEEENNRRVKEKNRETLALAEAVKAQRLVEVRNGKFGFHASTKYDLIEYYNKQARKKNSNTRKVWEFAGKTLEAFVGKKPVYIDEVDRRFVLAYRDYLERLPITNGTKNTYLSKFSATFNAAVKEELISSSPCVGVGYFKQERKNKIYLTIEEVKALARTPYRKESVKNAFLFGCLTGMRISDIRALTWGKVDDSGDLCRISFTQKKTRQSEYLDINADARALMGERGKDDASVFILPEYAIEVLRYLNEWATKAGIKKRLTFHSSRHTFATMMLTIGTDLYTVSKLLGHANINTTQVYARIVDKAKQDAMRRIPSILEE